MKSNPELLISTDEVNCKIYCDILAQEGIKFEVKESNVKTSEFGASFFGSFIYVRRSDIQKARLVLGLDKK